MAKPTEPDLNGAIVEGNGQGTDYSALCKPRVRESATKRYLAEVNYDLVSEKAEGWDFLMSLLPTGWEAKALELGAFTRTRNVPDPGTLLRLLLMHVACVNSLRCTTEMADSAGIATLSAQALSVRLRKSQKWLCWILQAMNSSTRAELDVDGQLRVRVVDGSCIQQPGSKGTDLRLHLCLDLRTLSFDWFELTDAHGGERLERTPMSPGNLLIADRNYLRSEAVAAACEVGAFVLIRMRWTHPHMETVDGKRFHVLEHVTALRENEVGEWPVVLISAKRQRMPGRVIVTRLPAELADQAKKRLLQQAKKKQKTVDAKSLLACEFVMLFTTVPVEVASGSTLATLYRCRWQIELAIKRTKSQHHMDEILHKDPQAAFAWVFAKLILVAMAEEMYRRATAVEHQTIADSPQSETKTPPPCNVPDSNITNAEEKSTQRYSDGPRHVDTNPTERASRKQTSGRRKSCSSLTGCRGIPELQPAKPAQSLVLPTPWQWNSAVIRPMIEALVAPRTLPDLIKATQHGALGHAFRDGPRKRKLQISTAPLLAFHYG